MGDLKLLSIVGFVLIIWAAGELAGVESKAVGIDVNGVVSVTFNEGAPAASIQVSPKEVESVSTAADGVATPINAGVAVVTAPVDAAVAVKAGVAAPIKAAVAANAGVTNPVDASIAEDIKAGVATHIDAAVSESANAPIEDPINAGFAFTLVDEAMPESTFIDKRDEGEDYSELQGTPTQKYKIRKQKKKVRPSA